MKLENYPYIYDNKYGKGNVFKKNWWISLFQKC